MTPLEEKIPEKIKRLADISYNLWWSWSPDARSLFKLLDFPLWRSTQHNPVQMLQEISVERLEAASRDAIFLRLYNKVLMALDKEVANGHTWFHHSYPQYGGRTIA
jgi:starch phosphorylase